MEYLARLLTYTLADLEGKVPSLYSTVVALLSSARLARLAQSLWGAEAGSRFLPTCSGVFGADLRMEGWMEGWMVGRLVGCKVRWERKREFVRKGSWGLDFVMRRNLRWFVDARVCSNFWVYVCMIVRVYDL